MSATRLQLHTAQITKFSPNLTPERVSRRLRSPAPGTKIGVIVPKRETAIALISPTGL
ncbi:hypothetical protein [Fischerella thermalis]|uniref:hypothetical protein n=1 Tax=Fischerella thermalis TaxID=372787 RepID=UPI0015E13446|nr:hypothetical protein [Fischerella thermalis]